MGEREGAKQERMSGVELKRKARETGRVTQYRIRLTHLHCYFSFWRFGLHLSLAVTV